MQEDYSFEGQRPDEEVRDVINSHPYIVYPPGLRSVLGISAAVALFLFVPIVWYLSLVLILISIIYFFNAFYSYRETIAIITNQRIFAVNQRGFFKRQVAETDLNKIVDVTSETQGFTKTLLKYGDLIVRTAGAHEQGNIVLKNIPHPYNVQQLIANIGRYKDVN